MNDNLQTALIETVVAASKNTKEVTEFALALLIHEAIPFSASRELKELKRELFNMIREIDFIIE